MKSYFVKCTALTLCLFCSLAATGCGQTTTGASSAPEFNASPSSTVSSSIAASSSVSSLAASEAASQLTENQSAVNSTTSVPESTSSTPVSKEDSLKSDAASASSKTSIQAADPVPDVEQSSPTASSQLPAAPATSSEVPVASAEPSTEEAKSPKEIAQSMIGANAADLALTIGVPNMTEYATSCIGDGEDGIWYYDGFTVYTYRGTDGSERIEDVF